jgi:DNA-directed RNA polymerase specialized sigma subunit
VSDLLVSDDELVFLIRRKHQEAFTSLLNRMALKQDRMIHKLLFMHRYCGLDFDDLKIVAIQTLSLAVESYEPKKNVFDAYYHFLLQRELVNELKRFSSDNQNLINTAISLDYEIEDGSYLSDVIGQNDATLQTIMDDPTHQLLEEDDQRITPKEKAILAYLKLGYTFTEIAKVMKDHYRNISKIAKSLLTKYR